MPRLKSGPKRRIPLLPAGRTRARLRQTSFLVPGLTLRLEDKRPKAEAIAAHGDHDDHWAALSAAGYELKTAARRMEQLYDKLGGQP